MNRIPNQDSNDAGGIWSSPLVAKTADTPGSLLNASTVASRLAMIENARQRSLQYGLKEDAAPDFSPVGKNDLALLVEQNHVLHANALPVMETLFEQIVNTHSMVVLTDANGSILHSLGDDDFLEKAERIAIKPGVCWSEQSKGTNAIGTALAEQMPTLVHASEHYLHSNHFLTCSAAPIFCPEGKIVGVLDVTGDHRSFHKHTMALVRMSAQMIENQLFSAAFRTAITLHFHSRCEFIGTLMEGIASFSPSGRFLSANRAGLFQLGLPLSALRSHTFSSLFGQPVSLLFDHYRNASPAYLDLFLHSGMRVLARAELRLENTVFQNAIASNAAYSQPSDNSNPQNLPPKNAPEGSASRKPSRMSGLRYLNTGDPQIAAAVNKVNKVLGRDIPILMMGETGTGKDLFAQAIHHDSPVAGGPFIAVNCASIPETLIESELFGYEDGAFTGARKKGSSGKILQANGGTLFLDEIGDMPLGLQARLLRVLQERLVTPLGSARSIPVNVGLICATNRNLRELIAQGRFREDLYYRLNGLVIKLPPLRERTDLENVTEKILAAASNGARYTIAPDVMQLFRQHGWPGNFRQLTNLLRIAMIMADDDRQIRREHLPDDFLDDIAAPPEADSGGADETFSANEKLNNMELALIRKTLEAHGGNVSAAARVLGISRNKIYRKMELS